MTTLTDFATLTLQLEFAPLGKTPGGMRLDVPFTGTAVSSHWEGERPVVGTDYVTVDATGTMQLDIRGRIGSGDDVVGYRAIGRATGDGPLELLVFETANEDLAWLNSAVAVAVGSTEGSTLTLQVSIVER